MPASAAADELAERSGKNVGCAARIVEHAADGVFEGFVSCVVRNIVLACAPQHLDHVGYACVDVILREGETGPHAKRVAPGDPGARVAVCLPFRRGQGGIGVDASVEYEHACERMQHALCHGP